MRKLRKIIILIVIASALWHVYGDTFHRSGIPGVWSEIRSDVNEMKENETVKATIQIINQEALSLFTRIKGNLSEKDQPNKTAEKPQLDAPSVQSFSVHNVELGEQRKTVEQQVGESQRSSLNEYGVHWITYHENYQNFFMVAYNEQNKVAGLYTNQDLLTSTYGITLESTKDSVRNQLGEPLNGIQKGFIRYQIQNDQDYDTFLIDNNYVTIFYDKHENNTVTSIQIISDELEKKKEKLFGEPSNELKKGFEYQLFDLTNATRVNHGLSILSWDEAVRQTARDHSQDMADNNYFSHTNLKGKSPFDRMREDDITFRLAGENLATGQSSSIFAHEGLMNSLGHRENILKGDFRRLGVGVAFNNEDQPFYTENFLTR